MDVAAVDWELLPNLPKTRRIRKLKTHPNPPVAWTVAEIARLPDPLSLHVPRFHVYG